MRTKNRIIALLLILPALLLTPTEGHSRHDMTEQLEYVGNPYAEYYKGGQKIYARNIWDMIEFKGKIYFGAGNSSNMGPATNAGPVPIMVYDPKTKAFSTSFMTSDDQVDRFYIFADALYVPGHDPKESWSWGNLYKTTDGSQWIKKRTIPNGVHTFCLATHNNKLFAGLGTAKGGGIAISNDFGDSWEFQLIPNSNRFYEFIKPNNKLYALGTLYPRNLYQSLHAQNKLIPQVLEYITTDNFSPRYDITAQHLFPDTVLDQLQYYKITRPQQFLNKSFYIGAYTHNDQQSQPFGIYQVQSLKKDAVSVKKIEIKNGGTPWDIYTSGNYLYVLTNKKVGKHTEVAVLRSHDLEDWEELLYFTAPQLVRSFIFSKGTFYFSFGCEIENPTIPRAIERETQTGNIFAITLYSVP